MKYDVVVVGSGPAGSVTARYAAEAGAKVLMIERRAEVGVPVLCGEGISQKVDSFQILEGKQWIASKMEGARIFSPNGTHITLAAEYAGSETGYVLYRDIFDRSSHVVPYEKAWSLW
jgi:digeranylgeranylglycerophospholipid reductase